MGDLAHRSIESAVGKTTAASRSPLQAATASPWSQISAPSGPWRPSSALSCFKRPSTSGEAALNCCRMPPGQSSRSADNKSIDAFVMLKVSDCFIHQSKGAFRRLSTSGEAALNFLKACRNRTRSSLFFVLFSIHASICVYRGSHGPDAGSGADLSCRRLAPGQSPRSARQNSCGGMPSLNSAAHRVNTNPKSMFHMLYSQIQC